jgi:hypothetical protein
MGEGNMFAAIEGFSAGWFARTLKVIGNLMPGRRRRLALEEANRVSKTADDLARKLKADLSTLTVEKLYWMTKAEAAQAELDRMRHATVDRVGCG